MKKSPIAVAEELRHQAQAAHEAELRRALQPLAQAFRGWERGELRTSALTELMRQFRERELQDLELRYQNSQLSMPVAYAIATGVLDRASVSPELLEHLAGALEFYASEPLNGST